MTKRENPYAVKILPDGWPSTGLLRVDQIIGAGRLPISRSQFYVLAKEKGLTPVKLSPRVSCYWVHELRAAFFAEQNAPNAAVSTSHSTIPAETTPHKPFEPQALPQSALSPSS